MPDAVHPVPLSVGYDTVPYPARAHPMLHPENIATTLTLLGLVPPDIHRCRVLEIGCATGGNLNPMADDLSSSQFVGIDFSAVQIDISRAMARNLSLANIEYRCQDIDEFVRRSAPGTASANAESFDFILAHGVYSWSPPLTRTRLLELCADRLAPGGVALVSFSVYPGWHLQEAIRNQMLLQIQSAGDDLAAPGMARVDAQRIIVQARDLLDYLAKAPPVDQTCGKTLQATAESILNIPVSNLIHDHLSPFNQPVFFSTFASHARQCGLSYLGDAQASSMFFRFPPPDNDSSAAPEPAKSSDPIAKLVGDLPRFEQLSDLLRNRPFRHSLLCRADAPPRPIESTPLPWRTTGPLDERQIRRLHVASSLKPDGVEPIFGRASADRFTTRSGVTATVSDPLLKSALLCLSDIWPARMPFAQLQESAWRRMGLGYAGSESQAGADRLCNGLFHAFVGGLVELSVRPAPFATRLGFRPIARKLVRIQSLSDDTVTTFRHENLVLNTTARSFLRLLDGTRDGVALTAEMERIVLDNARNIDPNLSLGDADKKTLATELERDLRHFCEEGLLAVEA